MRPGNRHLVIAGSNKCGTTSLFRYLGAHNNVCLSSKKEANFFYTNIESDLDRRRAEYMSLFRNADPERNVYVEASPTYLHGGAPIAQLIDETLPDSKVLLLFRDPSKRFLSYYKSKYGKLDDNVGKASMEDVVNISIESVSLPRETLSPQASAFRHELTMAQYCDFLPDFVDRFGTSRVAVFFFEDMVNDIGQFMANVCRYLSLDSAPYVNYHFEIENQTRLHRSSNLRLIASRANEMLEPVLNRAPRLRGAMRSAYNMVNAKPGSEISIDDASMEKLAKYYRPKNIELAQYLGKRFPELHLPPWLM